MAGWSIAEYSGQTLNDFISSGAPTTGGVYDFGVASGAANRALGLILTNGNSPEFGLILVNNSGFALTQVEISFTDEQWTENKHNQELDFYYGTTPAALPLSSSTTGFTQDANLSWATSHTATGAAHVDGTSSTFQQGMSDVISGLNWSSGSTLVLMWRELNSGNSAAMAIDNFSFSADAAAPAVTNNILTANQGTTATITSSQLSTTASPAGIPDSQIVYTVGSTPVHGSLENGGTTLTAGSSFTQDDIVAGRITYTPDGSAAVSDSFTFTVSDGVQSTTMRTFTVTTDPAANQPPVNTVPGRQTVIGNTSLVFSSGNGRAVSIADPDAGSAPVQVGLGVSHGILTLGGTAGLTITAGSNGSASLTFTGAIANINNALNGLTYVPAAGYAGGDALQIVSNDLGNTGTGGPQTATNTVALMDVAAPLLNEIEANPPGTSDNRYEYVELRGAAGTSLNDIYLVVFDGISTNNPGTADLVVDLSPYSLGSNGLLVINSASGAGHSLAVGTTLVSSSFFTQSGGFNNGTLSFFLFFSTIAFSSGADYDTNNDGVLDNLPPGSQALDDVALLDTDGSAAGDKTYGSAVVRESNNTGMPDAATRFTCNITPSLSSAWYGGELVDDGNVASQTNYDATRKSANEPLGAYLTPGDVNVPNDQPPLLVASSGALNYTEKQGRYRRRPGAFASDPDNSTLVSATVAISANYVAGEDILSFIPTASITGSFNGSTGILSLIGADTVADYQAALRSVCFSTTGNKPSTASRTVSFTANDGTYSSSPANRSITIVMPTVAWTGGAGTSSWGDAANWNSDAVPASFDQVVIDVPGPLTINHSAGNDTIYSLTLQSSQVVLDLSGGSLALLADSTVNGQMNNSALLIAEGGTLSLNGGGCDVGGTFSADAAASLLIGGPVSLNGTTVISGPGTISFNGTVTQFGTSGPAFRLPGTIHAAGVSSLNAALSMPNTGTTVDTAGFGMTLGGSVSGGGAGGLTKTGTGVLTMSATNSYLGGTTVLGGTLLVTSDGALPDGGSLTIGAGGTFVFDANADSSTPAEALAMAGRSVRVGSAVESANHPRS